jgi:DNA-binding transcriptional ArsR family regulator
MPTHSSNSEEQDNVRDKLLRAVSDRCRRRILRMLYLGPLPAHDLALHLEDPTRVGYHLSVLKKAGIVRAVRDSGRHVSYEYDVASLGEIRRWVAEAPVGEESV